MWFLNAFTNLAPATEVDISPVPAELISVAVKDVLNTVGALLLPLATINLSVPSKLNISKS